MVKLRIRKVLIASLISFYFISVISLCFYGKSLASEEEGNLLHQDAVRYARQRDYEQALQLIKEALKETNNSPEVVSDYIIILTWVGKYPEAIEAYEGLPGGYSPPDYVIPEVARSYRTTGKYEQAIALYKRYLEVKGEDREATKGLIYTYLDAGQIEPSRQYIQEQIQKDKAKEEWLRAYFVQIILREGAVRYARQGDYEQALQLIKEALKETDNSPEVVSDYIIILAWAGEYPRAIQSYQRLPKDYSPPDYLLPEVAKCYRITGKYDQAISLYKRFLEVKGQDEEATKGLIYTYREAAVNTARQGDFPQALQLIKEALKESNNAPEVVSDYIVILAWAGEYQEAINHYEALPKEYSPPDYLLPEVAKCYRTRGKYDQAISLYTKYLEVKTQDREATKGLIYTYLDAGQLEPTRQYIKEQTEKDKTKEEWLQLYLADILLKENKVDESEAIYERVFINDLGNTHAQLGVSRILIIKQKYEAAEFIIDRALEKEPNNIEALFCKGEVLEAQREYMAAYKLYERILSIYPANQRARDLKYRALTNMGATSLTREKLEQSKDQIDPEVLKTISGNEAMARIRWEEIEIALEILERNLDYAKNNTGEKILPSPLPLSADGSTDFLLRTHYDKILALRQKEEMEKVLQEYENLKNMNVKVPRWSLVSTADAYLYLQKPEKALSLYQDVLAQGWDPRYGNTRMSIYHTLIELGRYKEDSQVLENLDKEMPVQIIDRGILQDNLRKEEIACNRGWWFLYQDRLAEAQKYLQELLYRAPFDTHIRTALAQTYLWRGWPRLALQEFEINRTIDPKDIPNEIGYCYALNENDRGKEARKLAKELLKKYPKNKHIQRLNRYFKVQDMRTLTADASFSIEHPGTEQISWSTRLSQPIFPWRNIFAGYIWRDFSDKEQNLEAEIRRGIAGMDWRLNRDWWFVGSVSGNKDGGNIGYSGQLTFTPNDYLSFTGLYDSYSLAVPIRAMVYDVTAEEWRVLGRYRQSESFISEVGASELHMSDGHEQWSYDLRLDKALTTQAYWKTRLALEGHAIINSEEEAGVPYFSPDHLYSAYLIPMVEHVWFRRYEKALVDRLFLGQGAQWQKKFSAQHVWYIRYEQDYRLSDLLSFLVGTTFSKLYYDGEDTDIWSIDMRLIKHF